MSSQDDFFSGLKDEDDKSSEFFAGAEHFVRLKKQHGLLPDQDPEPLEKEAATPIPSGFTNLSPHIVEKLKKVLQEKKKEAAAYPSTMEALKSPKSIPMMAAMGLGLGGATYLRSRPKEELEGKSEDEVSAEKAVQLGQERPEGGLLRKLLNTQREARRGTAEAFRKHPAKATALGTALGAFTGLQLARLSGSKGLT